jgi:outer membrane protein
MKQLKKYALVLFVAVLMHHTKAQQANNAAFSLQQAVEFAVKNSPSYKNAELDMENAEYRKREITGLGLPQITGSFDLKDYLKLPTSLIPLKAFNPLASDDQYSAVQFGTKYNATAGLSASQLILSSDYIFALKVQKEFMSLSRINVTRSKSELVSQVSKAYYTVTINKDRIKLLDANIARLKKTYDDTKAFNQQGFAELIDVERLEVAYNNLITERDNTARMMEIAETMLKFQMGYKLSDPITLTDSLNTNLSEFQELSLGKMDFSQRPDYQLLQTQQTLLDYDIKSKKWGYMPTLAAYGAFQYTTFRRDVNIFSNDKTNPAKKWYPVALVGITLNVNIFDGLQRNYKIQQAKVASQKNLNTIKNLEMGAELEITSATITYNNAYRRIQLQKKNLELAQHVYDVAHKKYEGGVGSNLEVVTAETSMKEAQTNYYSAIFDLMVAKIDYLKATGTLVK